MLNGPYIFDYVCAQRKVIVELDGGIHKLRIERDRKRDLYLRNNNYIVLRFENAEVLRDLPGVLARILQTVETAPSPWPSPLKGERVSLRITPV